MQEFDGEINEDNKFIINKFAGYLTDVALS